MHYFIFSMIVPLPPCTLDVEAVIIPHKTHWPMKVAGEVGVLFNHCCMLSI